ncbi:unnamed protein product [Symbiodinium pilosum]|uniref:Uncharacterized protein n=1 Tax=Symbiodinium pilosum TaxID=2952 RepID=A0A812R0D8_SYMPI|nr:unnamed protein product [Symbiodinium pilosum]
MHCDVLSCKLLEVEDCTDFLSTFANLSTALLAVAADLELIVTQPLQKTIATLVEESTGRAKHLQQVKRRFAELQERYVKTRQKTLDAKSKLAGAEGEKRWKWRKSTEKTAADQHTAVCDLARCEEELLESEACLRKLEDDSRERLQQLECEKKAVLRRVLQQGRGSLRRLLRVADKVPPIDDFQGVMPGADHASGCLQEVHKVGVIFMKTSLVPRQVQSPDLEDEEAEDREFPVDADGRSAHWTQKECGLLSNKGIELSFSIFVPVPVDGTRSEPSMAADYWAARQARVEEDGKQEPAQGTETGQQPLSNLCGTTFGQATPESRFPDVLSATTEDKTKTSIAIALHETQHLQLWTLEVRLWADKDGDQFKLPRSRLYFLPEVQCVKRYCIGYVVLGSDERVFGNRKADSDDDEDDDDDDPGALARAVPAAPELEFQLSPLVAEQPQRIIERYMKRISEHLAAAAETDWDKLQRRAAEQPLGSLVGKLEIFWIHQPGKDTSADSADGLVCFQFVQGHAAHYARILHLSVAPQDGISWQQALPAAIAQVRRFILATLPVQSLRVVVLAAEDDDKRICIDRDVEIAYKHCRFRWFQLTQRLRRAKSAFLRHRKSSRSIRFLVLHSPRMDEDPPAPRNGIGTKPALKLSPPASQEDPLKEEQKDELCLTAEQEELSFSAW